MAMTFRRDSASRGERAMEKPTYQHECNTCIFLGSFRCRDEVDDLYFCHGAVVVVRNNNPEDTYSIPAFMMQLTQSAFICRQLFRSAAEGYRRARRRGLT